MSGAPAVAAAGKAEPVRRSRVTLWRDMFSLLAEFARAHSLAFGATVVLYLSNARVGLFLAAMSGIVDAAVRASVGQPPAGRSLVFWFVVFAVATTLERAYWLVEPLLSAYLIDHGTHRIGRDIILRAAAAPLIDYEDGEFFDRLMRATSNQGQRVYDVSRQIADLARVVLSCGSIVLTLGVVHPLLLPLLVAGSVPALWLQTRVAGAVYAAQRAHTTPDRVRSHIQSLLTGQMAVGEVRLFGIAPYLLEKWRALRLARRRDVLGAERRRAWRIALGDLFTGGAYAAALTLVAALILRGELSIGAYVAVATGSLWFQEFLGSGIRALRSLEEQSQFLGDLFEFLRTARAESELVGDAVSSEGGSHEAGVGERRGAVSIAANGVSFAYPGRPPVVRDIDLRIAAGERIAIVGENGAGKTTLAKLLVGLYQPSAGEVWLDGVLLTPAHAVAVRRRMAAVFQDYATFQLTVRENIGFGDVARMGDTAAIAAAAERAGIAGFVESLPQGYESFLGRQFGDRDLSGGQWQRIALARAFFRDADLLLLDEPTAALDPLAELALFERFAELAEGRTAIMISHRLGAARLADRVVVMQEGKVVEEGHHDDLVARGGEYARLFAAQAQWYRAAPGEVAAGQG